MIKSFFNSNFSHGTSPLVILENCNQSHLDSSQNSESSLVLNHDRNQLHSSQGISDADRLCPKSSTNSDAFMGSKMATIDKTPAGISLSLSIGHRPLAGHL